MGATMASQSQEKLIAPLSLMQMHMIHGHYKSHFKKEIQNPSADTNHIINFSLKMENAMVI